MDIYFNNTTDVAIYNIVKIIEKERLTSHFNINQFINKNDTLEKFLMNYKVQNKFFSFDIDNNDYQIILNYLKTVYPKEKTENKKLLPKIKFRLPKLNKKELFYDIYNSIILAFIIGIFYGVSILCIYSCIIINI